MAHQTALACYGGWLPASRDDHRSILCYHAERARSHLHSRKAHSPAVQAFKDFFKDREHEEHPNVRYSLFKDMLEQADPDLNQVKNLDDFCCHLEVITNSPPGFVPVTVPNTEPKEVIKSIPVGVPLYVFLDIFINTGAGYDLFRMRGFNEVMRGVLDAWGSFLKTSASRSSLNTSNEGWFNNDAIADLQSQGRGEFFQTYVCDPDAEYRGFASWDAFFTRSFRSGSRPPGSLKDVPDPNVAIYNACESTMYRKAQNVRLRDEFWLKGHAYSLHDMLNRDDHYAKKFEGGTVYQAFLSPFDYHRWHSPVTGFIEDVVLVPGTYYAALPDDGVDDKDPDLKKGDPRGVSVQSGR